VSGAVNVDMVPMNRTGAQNRSSLVGCASLDGIIVDVCVIVKVVECCVVDGEEVGG